MTARVSMVIAVRNGEDFVARAVRSALAQSIGDVEVLVADNGSTDATWSILQRLAADDPRVRPLRADGGRGAGYARNVCLNAATGEWLAVQDADDYMHPERLERLLAFAEARDARLVADNQTLVDPLGRPLRLGWAPKEFPQEVDAASYVLANADGRRSMAMAYLKPLVHRSLIEPTRLRYPEIHLGEDYQFLFDLLKPGTPLHLLPEPLYYYVQVPGSLSRTFCEDDLRLWLATNQRELATCAPDDECLRVALIKQRDEMTLQLALNAFVSAVKKGRLDQALVAVLRRPAAIPLVLHAVREGLGKRLERLLPRRQTMSST